MASRRQHLVELPLVPGRGFVRTSREFLGLKAAISTVRSESRKVVFQWPDAPQGSSGSEARFSALLDVFIRGMAFACSKSQADEPVCGIPAGEWQDSSNRMIPRFVQKAMKAAHTEAELMTITSSPSALANRDQRLAANSLPAVNASETETQFLLDLLLSRFNELVGLMQRYRASRDHAPPGLQSAYELDVREELLDVVLRCRFNTNDLVRLSGSLAARRGVLAVNAQQIELGNLREFVVAFVLCQALRGARARGDSGFVSVPRMVFRVRDLLRQPGLESEWRYPGPEDIHRAINAIRSKLQERRLNPFLIESGQRRQGYRLSTSPWNVQLSDD